MEATITVQYTVTLDPEDAEDIERGELDPMDLDWSYYVDSYSEALLVSVEV